MICSGAVAVSLRWLAQPQRFNKSHFSCGAYIAAATLVSSRSLAIDKRHGVGMVPFAGDAKLKPLKSEAAIHWAGRVGVEQC